MTNKPYVVRYFEVDTIGVISSAKTRLVAEQIMMEWNDWGCSLDVQYDPHTLRL